MENLESVGKFRFNRYSWLYPLLIIAVIIGGLYVLFEFSGGYFEYYNPLSPPAAGKSFWEIPKLYLPLIQSYLDWAGFSLSIALLAGSFFHFTISKNPFFPMVGLGFFFLGTLNVFNFLGIEQLIFTYNSINTLISLSSFLLRLFYPLIMLLAVALSAFHSFLRLRTGGFTITLHIVVLGTILVFFGYLCLYQNPVTAYFESIQNNLYFQRIPLALLIFFVIPALFYAQKKLSSSFSAAILYGTLPFFCIELYVFFHPTATFYQSLSLINSLELIGFLIPVFGMYRENMHFYTLLTQSREAAHIANEEKNQFISAFSYQLKTPLSSTLGFSELLLEEEDGTLNDKQKNVIKNIYKNTQEVSALLCEIIDISSLEAGKVFLNPSEVDLVPTIQSAIYALDTFAQEKKARIQFTCEDSGLNLYADPIRVREVLIQILKNAIQHTDNQDILVVCKKSNDWIEVSIQDFGSGMSHAQVRHLFEPTLELKDKNQTLKKGLGLAISKKIIDSMKGEIDVITAEGKGATLIVKFPRSSCERVH